MFILEMFEGAGRRVVVTYPGRFQPFHLGHADVFRSLQSRFGSDNVFIVTGNKTDGEKSPFNFSDKVRFMHAAGIPDHNVIEASKPYDLPDQFQADKENIIFITAVGAPDAQRLNPGSTKKDGSPSYFQQMPENIEQAASADRHGYVIIANERAKNITIDGKTVDVSHGTPTRALWNQVRDDEKKRAEFIKQLYGKADMSLGNILDKIPDGSAPPVAAPSPKLKKVKAPVPDMAEGRVISKDELVDIYLKGKHRGELIQKKVAQGIPNGTVNAFIEKVAKKFGLDPKAFVYGPANVDEGWFDTAKKAATWFLKKDGDVIRTVNGTPFTFKSKEDAVKWAMKTYKVSYNQQRIIPTTNPDKNLMTPTGAVVAEGKLNEFAPDEGGGSRKFIPWTEFIEQVKQIVGKDFSCKENIVKSTIKARFVPHDPMEYGPTMLYSYYETRAGGRNKGAVSTRGAIQVGKYTKGGLFGHTPDQLLTGFHLLKGHPFERHFDLTFDNIYKIANIIMGNTEGALEFKPEGVAEASALSGSPGTQGFVGGMYANYQARENQPVDEDYVEEKWSQKYKSSIDCSNPKGFSQKAHCQGRKK